MIKVNGKEIEFTKFPNGETNMNHESFPDFTENCGSRIEFKYEEDGDLIKLLFVRDYIMEHVGEFHELHLTVFYLPYSRMDRSVDKSPFTLKYVANFINNMEFDGIQIIEPHSDIACKLIWDSNPNHITKILYREVFKEIDFELDRDYVMLPDEGSKKRYQDILFPNLLIGEKTRNFDTGRIEGLEILGDIEKNAKKVLIIDDISSYGGTFCKSVDKLRELGFEEVYLLVAHSENSIFKGELFNHIDKVFTTDSLLTWHEDEVYSRWVNEKYNDQIKIYKMEDLLDD